MKKKGPNCAAEGVSKKAYNRAAVMRSRAKKSRAVVDGVAEPLVGRLDTSYSGSCDREADYQERFHNSTEAFDTECFAMEHQKCQICKIVSMQDIFKNVFICKSCAAAVNAWSPAGFNPDIFPFWVHEELGTQEHVPLVLSCLSEGEKLLIQQVSVYVPLHHLMYGQLGARGHIVSFPQDISGVCRVLPRLPADIDFIRVVKHFKTADGESSSKAFKVRRQAVLDALNWLQKYNVVYKHIEIQESNLDWITDGKEQDLTPTLCETIVDDAAIEEDRGPSVEQIAKVNDASDDIEPCYGTIDDFNDHVPKVKDSPVVETILRAEKQGKKRTSEGVSIQFPFVSPDPICEYTERHLWEKAFPWLFPGGVGGYDSIINFKPTLGVWMQKLLLHQDGRFARDKMWAFCALNFLSRHINQSSGGFFVETFFKNGPQSLEELQERVIEGDLSWLSSIQYFSQRVTGSTAYWRARRNEVFSWINYHLQQGNGPPSFFITLSCAEYHWKDIERLIIDRCVKGGESIPDFAKGRPGIINDYSIVVQEYFQKRVRCWLQTVGKDLLHIKHHWLRFEFAPSRGQIHAHMLAICDNLEMQRICHELRDKKEDLASYLGLFMTETLGMTASLEPDVEVDLDTSCEKAHPSTVRYVDICELDAEADTRNCQMRFQKHECSKYCMRSRKRTKSSESPESKLRRVCRCGAGVETNYMKCDTPGFPLLDRACLLRDIRGFDRVDLPRNNRRVTQSSKYLIRGWRGNCDIQLLIYKSHPNDVDASDISRVTNYVVSYACKGSETVVEEKKAMLAIIAAAQEEQGGKQDVKTLTRRLLNQSGKNRVVSKQEAMCQLAGLSLYSCSEAFEPVSLAGNTSLGTASASKTTFLSKYANRKAEYYALSLDDYFHVIHNEEGARSKRFMKTRIPIYSGAKCEPVYPATAAYARAVMLIYSAWHGSFALDRDNEHLLRAFEAFVSDTRLCPAAVRVSYNRAKLLKSSKEPTSAPAEMDYDTFTVRPDDEVKDLVELASTIFHNCDHDKDTSGMNYNFGEDHDWSSRNIQLDHSNEIMSNLLATHIAGNKDTSHIEMPLQSDGTEYSINNLKDDQRDSLAVVLGAVRRYCGKQHVNDDKVLRLTVSGVAGSGKSTWINTLVTIMRKLFPNDDTISVFAPTGSAAFNAGGQTLHKGFCLDRKMTKVGVAPWKTTYLLKRFRKMLVIIIDERSMLDAAILGTIQYYMQNYAHGGNNKKHSWGGIPIIIFVGDDYQLPPINAGAFYALDPKAVEPSKIAMSERYYELRALGFIEFIAMGRKVMFLVGEKRVNADQNLFLSILRALRCEGDAPDLTEEAIQRLEALHLSHKSFSDGERQQIVAEATFVFANKEPQDRLNATKLKIANVEGCPVARIKSFTVKDGKQGLYDRHFELARQPNKVLICNGARVTLNGYNPDPKRGLYHGSLGIVRDIVYDAGKTPLDSFPSYVLVEFSQYCGEDILPNMPKLIPIVPIAVRCRFECCERTYMPLALAYGKTAHTFQGQNVGPLPPERPPNAIQRIIIDPGTRQFEGLNVGLFYQCVSRGTTIGQPQDKLSSAIYFDGSNFSRKRFQNLTLDYRNKMYKKASLRKRWVMYLRQNELHGSGYSEEEKNDLLNWASTTKILEEELNGIIRLADAATQSSYDNDVASC